MSIVRRVAHVVIVLALPPALILAPMYLFITPEFVRHEYALSGFPPSIRYTPEERIALSDAIIYYVRGYSTREQLEIVRGPDGQPALTEREIDHLTDVRVVMRGLFVANGVALALAVVATALLVPASHRGRLSTALRQGVYATGGLLGVILVAALIDFAAFFTVFHQIFFADGTWLFDLSDTLIQLYPLPLWVDAVWKMGGVIAAELVAVHLLAGYLRRTRPQKAQRRTGGVGDR